MPRARRSGQPRSRARSARAAAARASARSARPSVAPPVSSPANAAPLASSSSTSAAATAPATLPTSASIAILRWNRCVTWTSVAPMPCITSIVERWVSSAPRAASTTAADGRGAQQQDEAERDPLQHAQASAAAAPTLSRCATIRAPGAIACDPPLDRARGSRPGSTSKLISAGTGSSALCAAGPSQRSSVRRISLLGHRLDAR